MEKIRDPSLLNPSNLLNPNFIYFSMIFCYPGLSGPDQGLWHWTGPMGAGPGQGFGIRKPQKKQRKTRGTHIKTREKLLKPSKTLFSVPFNTFIYFLRIGPDQCVWHGHRETRPGFFVLDFVQLPKHYFLIGGWGGESFCGTANREIVSFRSCVRARRSCVGEREAIRLCS